MCNLFRRATLGEFLKTTVTKSSKKNWFEKVENPKKEKEKCWRKKSEDKSWLLTHVLIQRQRKGINLLIITIHVYLKILFCNISQWYIEIMKNLYVKNSISGLVFVIYCIITSIRHKTLALIAVLISYYVSIGWHFWGVKRNWIEKSIYVLENLYCRDTHDVKIHWTNNTNKKKVQKWVCVLILSNV